MIELNRLYNMDCMDLMREIPDKFFELAIVDPPYGINIAKEKPRVSGRWNYKPKMWDSTPPKKEYFDELRRISRNQIIWGGNYFELPPCRGFVFWDKDQPVPNFADGEYAWTSFDCVAKKFTYPIIKQNFIDGKIHPTQKPVALYKWLLQNYAKQGDKILDTHAGSCSSVIAFIDGGFDYVACELDKDYYEAALKRIQNHVKQTDLFNERKQEFIQPTLL